MVDSIRMEEEETGSTLAYTKSLKVSKRTSFQDELEAAVNVRAGRLKQTEINTYSDDFEEDEDDDDDILKELLRTRRKKIDLFKADRTKPKFNHFELSVDEEENLKPKRVSFLKYSRKNEEHSGDSTRCERSDSISTFRSEQSPERSVEDPFTSHPQTPSLKTSQSILKESRPGSSDTRAGSVTSHTSKKRQPNSLIRRSLSESPVPLNSENSQGDWSSQWDSPLPLESGEEGVQGVCGADSTPVVQPRLRSPSGFTEDTPPRPIPSQRAHTISSTGFDREDILSSRGAINSSWSVPPTSMERCSTMSESDGIQVMEPNTVLTVSTELPASSDRQEEEECSKPSRENSACADGSVPSCETPAALQHRPCSSRPARFRTTVESKYLGTLKILDQKTSLQEIKPDSADSLRAAVYQDWLKKKGEKLHLTIELKKQEEKLNKAKAEEERSKKDEAKASYEAWKKKKRESLREQIREKQESMRKLLRERDEKEEKIETAKKIFEKWKQEHDTFLRAQFRKTIQTENVLKAKKEREQEERKRECSSTFAQWSERKKKGIQERSRMERKEKEIKEVEEKYEKEERERTALETYESWLWKKEFQQKQDKKQRKMRSTVANDAPPPWSPPNRTVPFRK